jgi:hypothetical protein
MAPDDPREPWDASGNDCGGGGGGGNGCVYWPSVADSGYISEGCDGGDDGDSFYFTPPEIEDPNEVREIAPSKAITIYLFFAIYDSAPHSL